MQLVVNIDWKVVGLAIILLLIGGSSLAISNASPNQQTAASPPFAEKLPTANALPASLGAPDYDSGWFTLATGTTTDLIHNLGTANLFVYMMGKETDYDYTHQFYLGYEYTDTGDFFGAGWYQYSTDLNIITVGRADDDLWWETIRVLIWSLEPTIDDGIMVVRGMKNDIYYRLYYNGINWGPWVQLPGKTPHTPAVTVINQYAEIVVTGMNNRLYSGWLHLPTEHFTGWFDLDGASPDAPDFATIPAGVID